AAVTRHPGYAALSSPAGRSATRARAGALTPAPRRGQPYASVRQLQRELQQPRRARRQDAPEVRRVEIRDRQAEVRVVEDVERLGTELEPDVAAQREAPHERHVDVRVRRPARDVPAGVAERPGLGQWVEPPEGRSADPLLDGAGSRVRV